MDILPCPFKSADPSQVHSVLPVQESSERLPVVLCVGLPSEAGHLGFADAKLTPSIHPVRLPSMNLISLSKHRQ